jgi:uncharacterized membrane protein
MAMRLQELHPALVHFPIALLPTVLAADALGEVTGSETLRQVGKKGMALAAASTVISALAGLVAQEEVKAEGHAHDLLVTHRNLNLGLTALSLAMAASRAKRRRPGLGYLLLGAAGLGVMNYTAYLGGHMVYEHGVGVKAAGGLREGHVPELRPSDAGEVLDRVAHGVPHGARHAAEGLAKGEVAPALTRGPEGSPIP